MVQNLVVQEGIRDFLDALFPIECCFFGLILEIIGKKDSAAIIAEFFWPTARKFSTRPSLGSEKTPGLNNLNKSFLLREFSFLL